MAREPVGRVRMTGDPIEDTASALVLASKLTGKAITDDDMADVLKDQGQAADGANLTAVRRLLP